MKKYGQIKDGVVVGINVTQAQVSDEWTLIPDNAGLGWIDAGSGTYAAPAPEPERVAYSSLEFMDLFTDAEESAIRILARSTDPTKLQISVKVEAFLARIAVASVIYLDDKRVVKGIAALRQLGIIETDARQADILAGRVPV
mgnify:CR=1 FL=1|tara:strand:- start:114 stop:539 length:426 start_codon:yes stop_codon:yes gene_type:complete